MGNSSVFFVVTHISEKSFQSFHVRLETVKENTIEKLDTVYQVAQYSIIVIIEFPGVH